MRRSGFTLLEGLVVSFLVLLLLGVVGGLVQRYLASNRMLKEKDKGLDSIQHALQSLRNDCQGAVRFLSPLATDPSAVSVLELDRPNPGSARLPVPVPTPVPASWEPLEPTRLVRIEYRVDLDQRLVRTSTLGGSDAQELARNCSGFSVRHMGARQLELNFSLEDRGRVIALSSRIFLPMGRR